MGGLSGAAFYGAGKAVDKIKRSVYGVDDYEPLGLIIGDGEELEVANKIAGSNTPKVFKIIGHGNPYGIRQGDRMLNAEELADMIRKSGDYVGGKQKIKC